MSTFDSNHTFTRSERLEEYAKLVRMLMRAYYSVEYVIIVDSLMDFLVRGELENRDLANPVRVSELIIASKLQMNPRRVREVLAKLRVDQLICGQQKVDEKKEKEDAAALANGSVFAGRINPNRPVYKPVATRGECVWWVDYDQLIRVVKYRHWAMLKRLNTKVDKSDVRYACPTPQCPQYRVEQSLFDLLMDTKHSSHGNDVFRCSHCQYQAPTGQMEFTPLRPVNDTSESGDSDKSLQSLKMKFTAAVVPLDRQIKLVDRLMEEDAEQALSISKEEDAKLKQQEQQQRMAAPEPILPPPTLQTEEAMKKKQEAEASAAKKAEEDRLAYEAVYKAELERLQRQQEQQQQELHIGNTGYLEPTMEQDQIVDLLPENEDIILNANGRQVVLSNITQEDINSMTEEEFAVYEMYAQRDDEGFA